MLRQQQIEQLDWQKNAGLIPAIVQHAISGEVLMLGYMNQAAIEATLSSQKVTFFSRSKQRLWTKGETSQNYLHLVDMNTDCDQDTLLVLAHPDGPTCHTGSNSCFPNSQTELGFLYQLEQLIASRKHENASSSYTARLYASGTKRIAQKVGEEGVETALAAMANDTDEVINETSDLIYHLLVLLQNQGISLSDVVQCLVKRHNT